MEVVVASVEGMVFDIERLLDEQVGAQLLPFPGMDKSTAAVCTFDEHGKCSKGVNCPFRHVRGDRTVVCKHWLRGLCKKGDQCEFLHEFDMTKMPECYFYSRFNACHNKECPFLHISPDSKLKDCPWYDRGFCRNGPQCRNRHVRRVLCMNYFAGFCPSGDECKFMHPRFELPQVIEEKANSTAQKLKTTMTCHFCFETGHRASHCFKANPSLKEQTLMSLTSGGPKNNLKKDATRYQDFLLTGRMDHIVCFRCGEPGHFANKCSKGQFAFLSGSA